MALKKTVKRIKGYVLVEIEGFFTERFINLTLSKKIKIWDIEKNSYGVVTFKVAVNDFKKLRIIAKKSKCKMKIKSKKGLPFLIHKYRKRKIFVYLIFAIILLVIASNMFVWEIEIIGNFSMDINEIKAQLAEENICTGMLKKDVDTKKAKLNMELKRNDIAWIGISTKGNKITVEIIEKEIKEEKILEGMPCNIISDKEGVVHKIYVAEGVANVQKGDTINKGQILISGIVTSEHADPRKVHAEGEVLIKTWYTQKAKVLYERDIINKTGKKENKYIIKLGNYKINLLNNDTKFEKYDTIISNKKLILLEKIELPIEVVKQTYEEINIETISHTKKQAEETAKNEAMKKVVEQIPKDSKIVNNYFTTREYEDGIEIEVTVECIEKTGTYEKMEDDNYARITIKSNKKCR